MSPSEAAAYVTARGYTDTVWQIERTGRASEQAPIPPEHGYVVPGAIIYGVLHMIVDQRVDATGVEACYGAPMP